MGKAIKKPVEIEFITFDEFCKIADSQISLYPDRTAFRFHNYGVQKLSKDLFLIETLEGYYNFTPQDVLIIGIKGEIYPCKIDIFKETYEVIQDRKDTVTVQEVLKPNIQISKYGPSVANNDPKVQHPTMVGVKISINQFTDCKTHEGKN